MTSRDMPQTPLAASRALFASLQWNGARAQNAVFSNARMPSYLARADWHFDCLAGARAGLN
jgi:hypothetical protein